MLISMLVIALAAAVIGGATMAWFTDSATSEDVTFTAGTLKIGLTETYHGEPRGVLKFENMNPGDVYEEFAIEIKNVGSKKLAWFGNWSVDVDEHDALLDAIYIESAKMEFLTNPATPANSANWEETDQFITDGKGSGKYPGWYNHLAEISKFKKISLRSWIDNNGMGTTPYEHMGALKPGYAYRLTMQFGFYEGAGNEYQGDVTDPVTLKFKVDATQINVGALNAFQAGFGNNHYDWLDAQIAKQRW